MRTLAPFAILSLAMSFAQSVHHPLDGLITSEYWTVYETLQSAGHATPDTMFASVLLHPPDKAAVLRWQPGQPIPRHADVVLLRGAKSLRALVDVAAKKVVSIDELKGGAQAPFLPSELRGADEYMKKDPGVIAALAKRGIKDLRFVQCAAIPLSYRAFPEQDSIRVGLGSCTHVQRAYHGWGRSIEGLSILVNVTDRKVIRLVDTDVVPVPTGDTNFMEIPETPRPYTTPLLTSQPAGQGLKITDGEINWQNWHFRVRVDPRVGVVLNQVGLAEKGRPRSILYEAHISELFVPYMDTATGWNNRAFIDAGEFFSSIGFIKPLRSGLDCPANAVWFDGLSANEQGSPVLNSRMACLFERDLVNPAWRHTEGPGIYGRPSRQLVLRAAAVVGNYDYILDWRFEQDGTIEVAVGATGVIETRATTVKRPPVSEPAGGHGGSQKLEETGQFVAENVIGVNHDHFFAYRLDFDVDGPANSFMTHKLVRREISNDPMRKSIWVAQPSVAAREKDAILDINLDRPSMWLFTNPSVKGSLNHSPGYEVMAGATAKSIVAPEDPIQKVGAFSEHQFWVTPYEPSQRFAAGTYPTSSKGDDGLAVWTQANRPIVNTDIVGWYTLGFHHVTRSEDWPVMPTMWHHFHIRPFHFFQSNPVLELPRTLGVAQPQP